MFLVLLFREAFFVAGGHAFFTGGFTFFGAGCFAAFFKFLWALVFGDEVFDGFDVESCAEFGLNGNHEVPVFVGYQGYGGAFCACASGTPDTVDIVFEVLCHVEVDDEVDVSSSELQSDAIPRMERQVLELLLAH